VSANDLALLICIGGSVSIAVLLVVLFFGGH
jgi:hypothetical protein